jgi:selenocysteine lyase/cysteine desulfurase
LRPLITGWFSEFSALTDRHADGRVAYGRGGDRFAGATYDPTAHYRGAAVFAFHESVALTPSRLREISRHQVGLLRQVFERLDLDPAIARVEPMPDERRAGFLAIQAPRAAAAVAALRAARIFSDARGNVLRLGPAPYVTDQQLHDGMAAVGARFRS